MKAPFLYPHPHHEVHHRSGISLAMGKLLLASIGVTMVAGIVLAIMIEYGF